MSSLAHITTDSGCDGCLVDNAFAFFKKNGMCQKLGSSGFFTTVCVDCSREVCEAVCLLVRSRHHGVSCFDCTRDVCEARPFLWFSTSMRAAGFDAGLACAGNVYPKQASWKPLFVHSNAEFALLRMESTLRSAFLHVHYRSVGGLTVWVYHRDLCFLPRSLENSEVAC